ncbi:MAG: DNA repair protein RecN [Deltaproteobacteria bacterium]|nr:DNA repair protein RecN [Deltaproteobacteria bacterium]
MLQELSIRNFAIIDDLNISFSEGLTVLSGETGAGKSIILNAVNLLLGSRATSKMVRTGTEFAELEAFFHITKGSDVYQLMEEHGYDPSEGLIIRRIISGNDRHRIYINGRIGTIQLLTSITQNLASISGQHAFQGLLKEDQHLSILDQFDNLRNLREGVSIAYKEIVPLINKLKELKDLQKRQSEHIELLTFQKKEIEEATLVALEDEELEKEKTKLRNSETLYQAVHSSIQEIYSHPGSVFEKLVNVKKEIEKSARLDFDLDTRSQEIEDIIFRVEDTASELREYRNNIRIDEGRLETVEERLDLLQKLKRKYGGTEATLDNIFSYYNEICTELNDVKNISSNIDDISEKLKKKHSKLSDKALKLSKKRAHAAKIFSDKIAEELSSLEMPDTSFEVLLTQEKAIDGEGLNVSGYKIDETGMDNAVFMISPNIGEALKPLSKIASGGELSRVVLAMKAILAEKDSVGTVIFDEVDAGIGGGIAEVVGKKITSLSNYHQVICITHLPQIAKFGNHHFKISKKVEDGRTSTSISPLDKEKRVEEIARMLGGIEITDATFNHAREMIENC